MANTWTLTMLQTRNEMYTILCSQKAEIQKFQTKIATQKDDTAHENGNDVINFFYFSSKVHTSKVLQ